MNLRSIDLNLLVVLDALLDEAHVSRAAERLGLSQPAASNALERCRRLFGDPLLERGRGTMRLTPKAESLQDAVRDLLARAETILAPAEPNLLQLRQSVRVVMADLPAAVTLGPLLGALATSAPGIDLVIQPWLGAEPALDALARGASDLAVSVFPRVDASFKREELFQERYLVLIRKGHPAARGFDLARWLAFPHIVVSGRGDVRGALDEVLAEQSLSRRIGLVVPSFLLVPPLVRGSDLIALVPSRAVPDDAGADFTVFEPPLAVPGFPLHIAWHVRRDRDVAVRHVAEAIRQAFAEGSGR